MNLITPFFSKANQDTLSGLSSQISILNNPTFGGLLSFDSAESEIDFRLSRRSAGITYFQLDTLGNGDSARRLGRMIIEDLKSLASEVYRTDAKVLDRPFLPIYIDEFGSFASSGFIEFLKQSRGANFGVHLFCQGLEDLDIVSPEFRRQVISNTLTKVGLRMDDHETVNEICATAGTFDALEQSHQVQGVLFATKTGMGNLRETKQMKIEHDVFKQLRVGEAVVIQKSPQQVSGIRIPMATQFISVS
jgi:type IV secretory pathway TraG/TraD family ATPase VirD4